MILMHKCVLDASALLALINQEAGADKVEKVLADSIISAVNYSEVATVLSSIGMPLVEVEALVPGLVAEVIPFDEQQALLAGKFREKTRHKGLSLGNRACLALGILRSLPVLTADKIWTTLELGVKIVSIR